MLLRITLSSVVAAFIGATTLALSASSSPAPQLSPQFFEGPNATGGWRFAATILA